MNDNYYPYKIDDDDSFGNHSNDRKMINHYSIFVEFPEETGDGVSIGFTTSNDIHIGMLKDIPYNNYDDYQDRPFYGDMNERSVDYIADEEKARQYKQFYINEEHEEEKEGYLKDNNDSEDNSLQAVPSIPFSEYVGKPSSNKNQEFMLNDFKIIIDTQSDQAKIILPSYLKKVTLLHDRREIPVSLGRARIRHPFTPIEKNYIISLYHQYKQNNKDVSKKAIATMIFNDMYASKSTNDPTLKQIRASLHSKQGKKVRDKKSILNLIYNCNRPEK